MDDDTLERLQVLCRDAYDLSLTGEIADHKKLSRLVSQFNNILHKSQSGQSIADQVKEWVTADRGTFFTRDMNTELGYTSRTDKKAADMALRRLEEKGLVVACGEKRGCWRPVAAEVQEIDWQSADPGGIISLKWPLGLEKYFKLYPTNICVVAGEKNSGKTAFLLSVAYLNHDLGLPIYYFSSEMFDQELAVRLRLFPSLDPFRPVHFYPALDPENLHNQVQPDAINIFDFLEIEDNFWVVNKYIRRIFQKLNKGIALIAIQKDPDSKYGRGRAFSTEKSRIYLTLTKKKILTMEEIKNWQGERNPNGATIPYQSDGGLFKRRLKGGEDHAQHSAGPPPNGRGEGVEGGGPEHRTNPGRVHVVGERLPLPPDS